MPQLTAVQIMHKFTIEPLELCKNSLKPSDNLWEHVKAVGQRMKANGMEHALKVVAIKMKVPKLRGANVSMMTSKDVGYLMKGLVPNSSFCLKG